MDRFVAMIWDQEEPSRQAQVNVWSEQLQQRSPKWCRVLDQPGVRVYSYHHRDDAPVVTRWEGENGIVVGVLFERGREAGGRVRKFGRRAADQIVASRGDKLIKDFWGNYVAIWRNAETRQTTVLRDPCGAVPCFMTNARGIQLFAAHLGDIADLAHLHFDIDWEFLRAFLAFNYYVTKYTGLKGVEELIAGERLECGRKGDRKFSWAWNGAEVASGVNLANFTVAKEQMRAVADDCFKAWRTEYDRILVSLSGGLDSTIVLNMLRTSGNEGLTTMHCVGVGYEQYELKLARQVADEAGVELVELNMLPEKEDLHRVFEEPKLARPKLQSLSVLFDDLSRHAADARQADAIMMGQGGDNLFLQMAGATRGLADYLMLQGFGREFWRIAYATAMQQRKGIWAVLYDAMESVALRRDRDPFENVDRALRDKVSPLSATARQAISPEYRFHPWLPPDTKLPAGKTQHLQAIVALNHYYADRKQGLERDVIYPLVSQPMTELCLGLPVYRFCEAGLDRALERWAFADVIPGEVFRRTRKGGANTYLLQVMEKNIGLFRQTILDGSLMKMGWLDKKRTEQMVSMDYLANGAGAVDIYSLFVVEAWLRRWSEGESRSAAA